MTEVQRSAEPSQPILELEDLNVWFPVHGGVFSRHIADVKAVDGISLKVIEGETLGVVGESGCGKSTLGKAVMGLVPVTSGNVHFHSHDGRTVDLTRLTRKEYRPFRSEIQMVYQDPYSSLNSRLSVEEIVDEPLRVHHPKMSREERRIAVEEMLERVGLRKEQAERYPHEFSGGQRQRIGIARALATRPRVIIADEPVSALDVSIQAQVINLMRELQRELGLTVIFIAHDISVVEHVSDRVAVMYLGNLVELGQTQEIFRQPKHPYTRALLSAVPRPDPDRRREDRLVLRGDVPSPMAKPSGCGFRTRCPIAQESCAEQIPPMIQVGKRQRAACPHVEQFDELLG
ncbi:MAG: ATP-binding cassette domain-containing protein [Planctomycetes bacterium]|jgi:oligopeptide/dipeptide ABC transporter ATP-binding protein|nr:ATP-binding cassette domain-containing protein [Planctomycetota bacterium]MBT6541620.1 ATP-binding cassette domain-containing protein [Planctomycetota bacterium]MBT7129734.1 ATP-binding cassette domain-containing protein [Planctomycetota bacterium]